MKLLHIGQTAQGAPFSLPHEAITETFAILAKRGVGKTYSASVMVEEMLKAGLRVCVADPIGVWWGLRASGDGKGPGLPIIVLGGDHGDAPLEVTAGEVIADLVAGEELSVVLDLSRFRKGEQTRFMTDFCERLYHKNRQPLHLVLDEADAFAPQRPMKGQERLLGAVEDLVRRGRARGLGITLVTQRAAVLNKDVLTQAEVLVTLRTIAPQDREAIDAWIRVHGEPAQREELMTSLPSLPIGTAWFWSPGWLDVFERVQIRWRETFDSSATPKVGAKIQAPRRLAEVDIEKLRERLAATTERARSDDPRELRRRIAELEKELRGRPAETKVEKIVEHLEVPVLKEDQIEQLGEAIDNLARTGETVAKIAGDLKAALALAVNRPLPVPALLPPIKQHGNPPAVSSNGDGERPVLQEGLSLPQQRILNALAAFETLGLRSVARHNLAVWSDQSPTSSGYTNNLGRLRSLGLIAYPGPNLVVLTAPGRQLAQVEIPISSLDDLHQAWYTRLSNPQARILQALVERYPDEVDKTGLAQAAGQSPTSSGYTNNLGKLRSLGLIAYPRPGYVAATELLFPMELREGHR
jgi:hypothetical protein